ncbi:MAG: ABC transporter substrate-binding protein [Thermomicrobiales bacterium]|nr:ABC transporter substrate-binding protein [Thermomicrobiales bacterium]
MTNYRFTRRALMTGLGGLGLTGVAGAQTPVATPSPVLSRIPSLRVGVSSLTNPSSMEAMWLNSLTHDSPFYWNSSGDILPGIATRASGESTTRLGLRVRLGTLAQDGTVVTPQHFLQALIRLQSSPDSWRLAHVIDTYVADDTLWIVCDRQDLSLQATLAHPSMAVSVNRVGTGPFQRGIATRAQAPYGRNPLFWQIERPHIDELQVIAIADDVQRSTAMATGELDLLPNVPLLDVPMLAAEPTIYLVGGASNRLCHLQLRMEMAPLNNTRVRQILSGAIDRAALISIATANQAEIATTLFPPDGWTEEIDGLATISADSVREEFRDLGLPTDIRLHLLTDNADATLANTAVVLQDQFANCGISLSITLLDGAELADAVANGDYDLLVSYSEPWRDPHELVWPLLSSHGVDNWSGFSSAEIDTLLRAAVLLDDDAFRRGRYTRLEQLVRRDVPVIPLFRPYVWDAVSTRYPGYSALPPATSRGMMTLLPTDQG